MKSRYIVAIIAALMTILLVYAAVAKLTDYYNFRFGLGESPFIAPFADVLAWALPAGELVIAVLLLLPFFRLPGLWASTVLMFLFTVYISVMLAFGKDIPCSCGGVLEEMSWEMHIVFNSFFVVIGIAGILLEKKRRRQLYRLTAA